MTDAGGARRPDAAPRGAIDAAPETTDALGARPAKVVAHRGGTALSTTDWLADETPVALVFNGISHAVMLATPLDLEDFALGFGLTERLLSNSGELYGVEVVESPAGITLELEVATAAAVRMKERRRTLAGRTGCGLCGTESLDQVALPLVPLANAETPTRAAIARAMRALPAVQPLARRTGAVHAAAWCSLDGEIRLVREDVGRHNALDKLVGGMTRAEVDAAAGFVCITSRASFEMVQKTAVAGVSLLAAVSAPTDLARRTALAAGVVLAGFVRGDDLVVYTHADRLVR